MEQDRTKKVNSMTELQSYSSAAFCTNQTQSSKRKHREGNETKNYTEQKKRATKCSFSGSSHRASDCLKYANINDRLEVAKHEGLYFNCLGNTKMDRLLQLNAKEEHAQSAVKSTT